MILFLLVNKGVKLYSDRSGRGEGELCAVYVTAQKDLQSWSNLSLIRLICTVNFWYFKRKIISYHNNNFLRRDEEATCKIESISKSLISQIATNITGFSVLSEIPFVSKKSFIYSKYKSQTLFMFETCIIVWNLYCRLVFMFATCTFR